MVEIVVDASLASAWCFPDERTEYTNNVLTAISGNNIDACAPNLLAYEIRNVVLMGVRRGRITHTHAEQFLASIKNLGLRLIDPFSYDRIFQLASETGLTFYDASYLELALRKNLQLAGLDQALNLAAVKKAIVLFEI